MAQIEKICLEEMCIRLEAVETALKEAAPEEVWSRRRVAVEAAHRDWWFKYVGLDGRVVGMSSFGESAPAGELFKEFGFTVDNIVAVVTEVML